MAGFRNKSSDRLPNPAKARVSFRGLDNIFEVWDVEKKEKQQHELLQFVVLTEASMLTFFDDTSQSRVATTPYLRVTDIIAAFKGGKFLAAGTPAHLRAKFRDFKYVKVLVCALYTDNGLKLAEFEVKGGALSAYIESQSKTPDPTRPRYSANIHDEGAVLMASPGQKPHKKGATTYYIPNIVKKGGAEDFEIEEMQKMLSQWMDYYSSTQANAGDVDNFEEESGPPPPPALDDNIPF